MSYQVGVVRVIAFPAHGTHKRVIDIKLAA